jgi:hypothetical protein
MPSARPRSAGPKVSATIAVVSGIIAAAPTPWTTRAAISASSDGARPHASEAAANNPIPAASTREHP